MVEKKFWKRPQNLKPALRGGFVFLIAASTFGPGTLQAQQPNNAAASGMTTGLPGVSPAREAELMNIRARAQAAKPEAEAAAMQRSAERALDQKANQNLLREARETKLLKQQAARNLEYEKAANAYRKVSRSDIAAYSSNNGRVKVQQEVPGEFYAALPPEDEDLEEDDGKFRPFRGAARGAAAAGTVTANAAKKAVSWIPFVGKKDKEDEYIEPPTATQPAVQTPPPARMTPAPAPATATTVQPTPRQAEPYYGSVVDVEEKDGMFKKMGNFFKRDKDLVESPETVAATTQAEEEKSGFFKGFGFGKNKEEEIIIDAADPTYATAGGSQTPAPGVALFGPQVGGTPVAPAPPSNPFVAPTQEATPPPLLEPEKKGMFSGFKNFAGKLIPGKKDQGIAASGPGSIDSSLFPQEGDSSQLMADTSSIPKEKKKLKLPSFPDKLIPSPEIKPPEPLKAPTPKKDRSPVHSGGSDLYVVEAAGTQFLRFGSSQMSSESMSLQPGTVVRMTKVGDEWSSIQLSNGSTGIVPNKSLRPAGSSDAATAGSFPGSAAAPSPPIAATTNSARITRPVSATGASTNGGSNSVGPPVSIPESRLTTGTTNSGLPVDRTP